VLDIEVRRDDLRTTRVVDAEPGAGDVTLHIDRFGLTANNVTYGVFGDAMSYWAFFPASEEGWGRIPVWGYGDVVGRLSCAVRPSQDDDARAWPAQFRPTPSELPLRASSEVSSPRACSTAR
jgi:hypothetical protein